MPLHQNSGVMNTVVNGHGQARDFKYVEEKSATVRAVEKQRQIGFIADYDPLNFENQNFHVRHMQTTYSTGNISQQQKQQVIHQQKVVSYNSASNIPANFSNQFANNHHNYKTAAETVRNDFSDEFTNSMARLNSDIKISVYKAIYDYDGKEEDELSFRDGDKFINCEQIDVGWMIGVHERTMKHGMFPSNYAEPVDIF
jgi:hypothetical protein